MSDDRATGEFTVNILYDPEPYAPQTFDDYLFDSLEHCEQVRLIGSLICSDGKSFEDANIVPGGCLGCRYDAHAQYADGRREPMSDDVRAFLASTIDSDIERGLIRPLEV